MRALWLGVVSAGCLAGCAGWNPSHPFERDAPPVREAIAALDAGDATAAAGRLEEYLSTGPCKDGNIGTPDLVRRHADGTFDLGLSLFRIGEQYGRRFGEEESAPAPPGVGPRGGPRGAGDVSEASRAQRHAQIVCAHSVVQAIALDPETPADLRLRAQYLDGNLSFLDGEYEQAVRAYDQALTIAPGQVDAGDPVARDAAWNRAIALERIEDKKDAGADASRDASGDSGGGEGGGEGGGPPDAGQDGGGRGGDDGGGPDSGNDAASPPPEPPDAAQSGFDAATSPPLSNEDERMLDQLENAPTVQQEAAKHTRRRRVLVDK
jgi:hypothetical protein